MCVVILLNNAKYLNQLLHSLTMSCCLQLQENPIAAAIIAMLLEYLLFCDMQ